MERDLTPREGHAAPPDDAELGALVRAVAEDWHQPPQRLDQPTWRERVEVSRRSSRGGGRRWFGRIAEAGVLAVVATLVLAVGAVFLTSPGRNGGIGSNPSTTPTEDASPIGSSPVATPAPPLPALVVNGDLPSVTSVLLQGSGGYRLADLATGSLKPDLPWEVSGWNTPLARPGGGWICVCGSYTPRKGGPGSDELVVTLRAIDTDGAPAGSTVVRTLLSAVDPDQPPTVDTLTVDVRAFLSADGRFGFIGWSERSATGWQAGVDVVDLGSLQVIDRLALPSVPVPADAVGRTLVRLAPLVDTVEDVGTALITVNWFVEDPLTARPPQGTDRWSATFVDGSLGDPISAGARTDPSCYEWEHGVIDAGAFYVACIGNSSGAVRVERYAMDGSEIDRAEVGQFTGFGAFAARPDHRLFLWDPQDRTLMSYDLRTGKMTSLKAPDTAGPMGPLDVASAVGRALGSWIAPTAAAKIWLQPALAVSPDGTRLYAIGIEGSPSELGGSAGIFAFDISGDQPALVGHWPPNADYISLTVSEDGAFVYAAGIGGVDAQGQDDPAMKPSITVFEATDGSIRLVAGQLEGHELLFTESVVR